jgi:serine O-acetyltransferase
MSLQRLFQEITLDLHRYTYRLRKPAIGIILLFPGFQALAFYRLRRWLNTRSKHNKMLWWPIIASELIIARLVEIVTGIYIDVDAQIGIGLFLPHFGGIVIGQNTIIGRNCIIYQGVTLGFAGRGGQDGFPAIGDRVLIAAGAKVIGPINVGNDVLVGANAVVTRSIPDRAVAVGIPARIVSYEGSFEFVHYPNEDQDIDRINSLHLKQKSNLHEGKDS